MPTELTIEQAIALIQTNYVDRVFGFLNGKFQQITTPKDYINTDEVIYDQCAWNDNGERLFQYFQQIIKDYIN